ncbi:MAG: hypothetical protein H8E12_17005 [Rhodobacteraceae bacterium]|nr:hypothetical protein [Paracoccaceae bacterium]
MSDKLKSRKLWVALGGVLVVIATEWLGLPAAMSQQIVDSIIVIIPSYLAGQGLVDAIGAYNPNGKKK